MDYGEPMEGKKVRPSDEWFNEMQRRILESLNESKREVLRDEFGMLADYRSDTLSPEIEGDFLDYVLEFERQFEKAKRITVRERIGDPPILPLDEIPVEELQQAIDSLLDLLKTKGIFVDFLGEVEVIDVYRYLTGELLDEEIDDINIPGTSMCFTFATPEYNAEMWTEEFVVAVLRRDGHIVHPGSIPMQFYNPAGIPITEAEFQRAIVEIWSVLPSIKAYSVEMLAVQVTESEAQTEAIIKWTSEIERSERQVTSTFLLHPSPYLEDGWEVVQTSFLDDLRNRQNDISAD